MNTSRTSNAYEALADHISPKEYGSVVHYQDIEECTGEKRGTSRFNNTVKKAKKVLEKRGKMIRYIGGGDYIILHPGDYVTAYAREVRIANNHIKNGGKILEHAPVNDMTQSELSAYNRVNDFHMKLSAAMAGSKVEIHKLADRSGHAERDIPEN